MRWFTIARTVHRYWRMAHDPRTPKAVRWLIYGGIAYTVIPDDWKPEGVPLLGLLDDAAVIPMTVGLAMALIPKEVKTDVERAATTRVGESKRPSEGTPAFAPVSS